MSDFQEITTPPQIESLPNLLIVEKMFGSVTYILDLHPETNPKFYTLVTEIDKTLGKYPRTLEAIVGAINQHAPQKESKQAVVDHVRKTDPEGIPIPIDNFFDSSDPAARCLERSILTQAVLAQRGINSSLVNYIGSDVGHIVVEVERQKKSFLPPRQRQTVTIDSNLLHRPSARIVTQSFNTLSYEKQFGYHRRNPHITPNIFSPRKSTPLLFSSLQ